MQTRERESKKKKREKKREIYIYIERDFMFGLQSTDLSYFPKSPGHGAATGGHAIA